MWQTCALLRGPGRVANHQIKRPGSNFAEAAVSIEGNSDADRWIVSGEAESAFQQTIVNLVYMQRTTGLAQNHSRGLRNCSIEEAIADGLNVRSQWRNILSLGRGRVFHPLCVCNSPVQFNFKFPD